MTTTTAERVLEGLARRGTKRIYGLPGGGSSLDLIAAAPRFGMRFVLARHEGAAAMMATADAELTGAPGAVLTTKGPGIANAANGIFCATLERAPVVLLSDGFTPAQTGYITHQVTDQRAMTAAIAKGYARCEGDDPAAEFEALLDLAMEAPRGAVHLDLTSAAARRPAAAAMPRGVDFFAKPDFAPALALLVGARKPVVIAGLEAADDESAEAVRALVAALGCPALVTYKAKGVVPDADPAYVGLFTGGSLEAPCVDAADLIILAGLDPVELILQPWRHRAPVLEVGLWPYATRYAEPACGLYGPIAPALHVLAGEAARSLWTDADVAAYRDAMREGLAWRATGGIAPPRVVELAQQVAREAGRMPRVAVDAGAHMFSATAFWRCEAPRDLLISNGLASMGFALPAAIAAALHDPARGGLAFTGDGGLMMCVAELATAVETGARCVTVVFNDAALSLIDIKQQQRQLPPEGVRWARPDFARIAEGFGVRGFTANDEVELMSALRAAFAHDGPSLVDVHIDPAGYAAQLQAMRG